jgi:hypothetical protein
MDELQSSPGTGPAMGSTSSAPQPLGARAANTRARVAHQPVCKTRGILPSGLGRVKCYAARVPARALPFFLAASLLLGCQPEFELDLPPIRYRTEHLRVGTESPDLLCQGSLALLDEHVALLEERFGFELGQPIDLYLYVGQPPCGEASTDGCYYVAQKVIVSHYWAARHEIDHAVEYRWGMPADFFSEGFAEAFSGYRSSFQNRYDDRAALPSHYLGVDSPTGSVDVLGAHFMRWLYEAFGAEPLRELMRRSHATGAEDARAAFRTAYGMEIENAEQRYYVEAPDYYSGWSRCFSELELVAWDADRWQPVVELDCAQEHTRGQKQMQRTLGFDLAAAGRYVFEVEAPATAFIGTCQTEVVPLGVKPPRTPMQVEREPISSEQSAEDGSPDAGLYQLESGLPHLLDLVPGRYRVTVTVPGTQSTTVRLSLEPQLGAVVRAPAH